jgi:Domain of unknown function DUF11/SdrD B-like domain
MVTGESLCRENGPSPGVPYRKFAMRWTEWVFRNVLRVATKPAARTRRSSTLAVTALEDRSVPSVSGAVIRDYNQNGTIDARDLGVPNITVRAFDSAGTLIDTVQTNVSGQYTLTNANGANLRIEFGPLPAFLQPGRASGQNSAIQFADGTANPANVNFLVHNPADFSQANPFLVTPVYERLDPAIGTNGNQSALTAFPYTSNGQPTTGPQTSLATFDQLGTTWGVGWNDATRSLYVGAFMKRHAAFGPNGTGAIYRVNPSFTAGGGLNASGHTTTLFADLSVALGGAAGGAAATTGTNPHPSGAGYDFEADNTGTSNTAQGTIASIAAVGKIGLGGIAVSDDNTRLYVMNLNTRSLMVLGINASGAWDGTVQSFLIPNAGSNADLRPFAVTVKDGQVYVGVVDSAQTSGNAASLNAFVYRFDPGTSNYTQVLTFPLGYPHGDANVDATVNLGFPGSGLYRPWTDVPGETLAEGAGYRAEPMLTDIAFDASGAMVVGIRDRQGDQILTLVPNGYGTAGDVLRAAPVYNASNVVTGYTLENAGAVVANGSIPARTGTNTANNQGPGNGEFYGNDSFGSAHEELFMGALHVNLAAPTDEVAATSFDPFDTVNSAGVTWNNNLNGQELRGFEVYRQNTAPTFGKSNGIGDLNALAAPAPLEIGNRVWNDNDRDGIQDGGETGIAGVTVLLFEGTTQVGTTVTDANGIYAFNDANVANTVTGTTGVQPNTAYQVRISTTQTNVANRGISPATQGSNTQIDSNGIISGGFAVANVTTGAAGQNDETIDFGFFSRMSIGNRVWNDANNDGLLNNGESGIVNVRVELYTGAGAFVSFQTTDASGFYSFTDLAPGTYRVRLAAANFSPASPLTGFASSTGINGSPTGPFEGASTPNPNNGALANFDIDDNGTTTGTLGAGGFVESGLINLQPGTAPTGEAQADATTTDNNSNFSVDFGVFPTASLTGNVFVDTNTNGIRDPGENTVLPGVTVTLTGPGGINLTATTDAGGNYSFPNLAPGAGYTVTQTQPNGYGSSTPNVVAVNVPAVGGAVVNFAETVGSLGGRVWLNSNNLQDFNGPDVPLQGIIVTLAGTDAAGTPVNRSATTDATGNYLFNNLLGGTYTVTEGTTTGVGQPANTDGIDFIVAPSPGTAGNDVHTVTFPAAATLTGYNFTEIPLVSTGGFVYEDLNANGTRDVGEPGIPGVPVTLSGTNVGGVVVNTTVNTIADGSYNFTNIQPSTNYTITEGVVPVPFLDGREQNGTPPAATVNNDNFTGINLTASSAAIGGFNFGEVRPASIAGVVYLDRNNNGIQESPATEPGVAGVTVRLTGTDDLGNPVNLTIITTPSGAYSFNNLRPGLYTVTETQPANLGDGLDTIGLNGGGTAGNDFISGIRLNSGTAATAYNFGENDRIDLRIIQTVSKTNPKVGEIITITYRAVNDGPAIGNNVLLTTNLPAGLQFVSANTGGIGTFNPATGVWTIGTLNVGQNIPLTVQVRVTRPGTFNNPAAVSASNFETNLLNNQSAITVVASLGSTQITKRRFLSRSR